MRPLELARYVTEPISMEYIHSKTINHLHMRTRVQVNTRVLFFIVIIYTIDTGWARKHTVCGLISPY